MKTPTSLKEHFENLQAQRGLPVAMVEKLLHSWRVLGHEEHSLYALCLEKKPEDRNALQAILMKELGDVSKIPAGINLCELIADTAAYFIPAEDS